MPCLGNVKSHDYVITEIWRHGNSCGAGDDSCASLQNSTLQDAVPYQDSRAAAKQPWISDSSEEERHNFALSKDGAKIVASNKEAKKTSAILDTDSDTFMKNECKADKWFIIELSQVGHQNQFQTTSGASQAGHLLFAHINI